jgi:C-terminal processing protease CtpA/Prc
VGRFAAASTITGYVRFRDGPRHDDLGPETTRRVEPRGAFRYSGPVVVLSGRGVFSSNESFISAMRALPNVTILGDTTGGGSGNPAEHSLGDGWRYTVSRWIEWTADRRVIEWQGIPPDVYVPWDPAAVAAGRDPVLEAALTRLGAVVAR